MHTSTTAPQHGPAPKRTLPPPSLTSSRASSGSGTHIYFIPPPSICRQGSTARGTTRNFKEAHGRLLHALFAPGSPHPPSPSLRRASLQLPPLSTPSQSLHPSIHAATAVSTGNEPRASPRSTTPFLARRVVPRRRPVRLRYTGTPSVHDYAAASVLTPAYALTLSLSLPVVLYLLHTSLPPCRYTTGHRTHPRTHSSLDPRKPLGSCARA
ncbi:hypothetical protein D9611_014478 [Ephemerocybe angulata]|uniref:Uncharacterized protein n=1 Tax=Ephemerocybe angulata TaxID=980116 RepID=A0A8H5FF41_9AGAR|nr:hypothetical protein D9611_014478 [Tulosesus angulatus]